MNQKTHTPRGANLERIEELSHLGKPDWVPYIMGGSYVPGQDYSGFLRQISSRSDVPVWLEEILDQAAERLDQAHEDWLEAQLQFKTDSWLAYMEGQQ